MPPKFKRRVESNDMTPSRDVERVALLDGNSEDDDFFLRGPNVKTGRLNNDPQIDRVNNQVNEVIDVMKNNVSKVLDRGERLDDLQDKSDSLAFNSDKFRTRAVGLRRHMWWNNCRAKVIITVVILVILTIIIVPIVVKLKNDGS